MIAEADIAAKIQWPDGSIGVMSRDNDWEIWSEPDGKGNRRQVSASTLLSFVRDTSKQVDISPQLGEPHPLIARAVAERTAGEVVYLAEVKHVEPPEGERIQL